MTDLKCVTLTSWFLPIRKRKWRFSRNTSGPTHVLFAARSWLRGRRVCRSAFWTDIRAHKTKCPPETDSETRLDIDLNRWTSNRPLEIDSHKKRVWWCEMCQRGNLDLISSHLGLIVVHINYIHAPSSCYHSCRKSCSRFLVSQRETRITTGCKSMTNPVLHHQTELKYVTRSRF